MYIKPRLSPKTRGQSSTSSHTKAKDKSFNFKKNILPPLIGLLVFLVFSLGFNSQYISGRIAYGLSKSNNDSDEKDSVTQSSKPQNKVQPKIIINKISVDAPIIFQDITEDETEFQKLLQNGVVHYPNTARPGEAGNVIMFGHSSGAIWSPGDFKFIFSLLEKLETSDKIFVDYNGTRYMYEVSDKTVVLPTDVSVLRSSQTSRLTLITCTPVGTNTKRLVITAKQVMPIPTEKENNSDSPELLNSTTITSLPGDAPSVWKAIQSQLR